MATQEIEASGTVVNAIPEAGLMTFDDEGNFYLTKGAGTILNNGKPFATLPISGGISGLAVDHVGNLYVTIYDSRSLGGTQLFRIEPSGVVTLVADSNTGLANPVAIFAIRQTITRRMRRLPITTGSPRI